MKAELIKNFVKRELLNKHLTNESGQLSQYGKEFMMNHFHLPEDRVPTDLFDESGITCIGSPREIRSEVDLMREAANPNHWVRFLYQDITPDVIYNFCSLFDILAKDNATGYDVVWELGGHWSTRDCPVGVPIGVYVNEQIERCIFKQWLMEGIRRRIEQERSRRSFRSRYHYDPSHVWEWGDRMTSIRPFGARQEIGYDLGYGHSFDAWSTWYPTGGIVDIERSISPERGFPDPEEQEPMFDHEEMEQRYYNFLRTMGYRDDDKYYDVFNHKWIELTKKEPEIDFNSPEWTEVKL